MSDGDICDDTAEDGEVRLLKLLQACLSYVDKSSNLMLIKDKCKLYENLPDRVFEFVLPIDVHQLVDINGIGTIILKKSMIFYSLYSIAEISKIS